MVPKLGRCAARVFFLFYTRSYGKVVTGILCLTRVFVLFRVLLGAVAFFLLGLPALPRGVRWVGWSWEFVNCFVR